VVRPMRWWPRALQDNAPGGAQPSPSREPSMCARSSVFTEQRGLLLRVRKPLASTSPSAEFCSSWVTTSGVGTEVRETRTAPLPAAAVGAILAVFRLIKRSMMSASATMEEATKGQMGQPAACMIESKCSLRGCESKRWGPGDYGVPGGAFPLVHTRWLTG
jgi:hypothetical protein